MAVVPLVDLSITGGQLATSEELARLLASWPRLIKLRLYGDKMIRTYYQYRLQFGSAVQDIAALSEGKIECLGLECLTTLQYHLPTLKVLGLTLMASPTDNLQHALRPFKNLELMVLPAPFRNFKLPGFVPEQAAQFISSFLGSSNTFLVQEDGSLLINLDDLAEEKEEDDEIEGIPLWMEYAKSHNEFCLDFQAMVSATVDARSDERTRLAEEAASVEQTSIGAGIRMANAPRSPVHALQSQINN